MRCYRRIDAALSCIACITSTIVSHGLYYSFIISCEGGEGFCWCFIWRSIFPLVRTSSRFLSACMAK